MLGLLHEAGVGTVAAGWSLGLFNLLGIAMTLLVLRAGAWVAPLSLLVAAVTVLAVATVTAGRDRVVR